MLPVLARAYHYTPAQIDDLVIADLLLLVRHAAPAASEGVRGG